MSLSRPLTLLVALLLALPAAARSNSQRHRLAPGVTIEPGSTAFFSDLHVAYGKAERKTNPTGRKNLVAIANLLRTTSAVSEVVFAGDFYRAPQLNGLSVKQKRAALVRGVAGLKQRLGDKPLRVVFGNHDVPFREATDPRSFDRPSLKWMADALEKKNVGVIGTLWDRTYKVELSGGALIRISHTPSASSVAVAEAMQEVNFDNGTERARAKMTDPPRRRSGEWVSADSHVAAFSTGKATIVNLGTAGSLSRPIGDPFTVAIRQPTRGWLFLRPTDEGFVSYDPRGSASK